MKMKPRCTIDHDQSLGTPTRSTRVLFNNNSKLLYKNKQDLTDMVGGTGLCCQQGVLQAKQRRHTK